MTSLKSVACLALAAFLCTGTAHALDASAPEAQTLMKGYFGNTRICREDGLFECHMWLNADGTYILFGFSQASDDPRAGFHVFRGKWSIQSSKGNYKLCRIQEDAKEQEHKPTCGLPEPERPDLNGAALQLGDSFWKYHEEGNLKGTTEHYYLVKG